MRRRPPSAASWIAALLLLVAAPDGLRAELTAAEVRAIVGLGPWPPTSEPDPSNRLDGNRLAIDLGRRLFFERDLSRHGVLACASCHRPEQAWTDGRMQASRAQGVARNTPTVRDLAGRRWFGWGGASDTLWGASLRAVLDRRELAATPDDVRDLLAGPDYREAYRALTGRNAEDESAEAVLVVAGKALAAFQATIVSPRTMFDALRDRLAEGSDPAAALGAFPAAARDGLKLFVGRGGCVSCHGGPRLAVDAFARVAAPSRDRGRADDTASYAASPYRRDGVWSDAPEPAFGSSAPPEPAGPDGAFRVPSLRGLASTAPYFHDGSRATLVEAVRHGPAEGGLSEADTAALVAFLATLDPQ